MSLTPHIGDQPLVDVQDQHRTILDCMAELGWSVEGKSAKLNIGCGVRGGALNPDGVRIVSASFLEDPRWMALQLGWGNMHEQRIANYPTARAFAKSMNDAALKVPSDL